VTSTPRRTPGEPTAKSAGRDRPNSRGESTRLLILKKAEELFAHQGIAAVPLRDIGLAAGQKNNVAVQYHFGDKETLLREITAYRARVSEERRAELLADMLSAGKPPQISDLVRSWIDALAYHLGEDNPEALVEERWMVMMTSAVHALARYQTAARAGKLPAPLPDLLEDLVTFFAAGLAAPPSARVPRVVAAGAKQPAKPARLVARPNGHAN
jgi:AcrR family transcriptional regulator